MLHICLACKKDNTLSNKSIHLLGQNKNILNLEENLYAYECPHCHTNNIIYTDMFNNTELNSFLYEALNYEVIEFECPKKVYRGKERFLWNKGFLFHKVEFINNAVKLIETSEEFESSGIYIISFKDKTKKFNSLKIFEYYSSNIISF